MDELEKARNGLFYNPNYIKDIVDRRIKSQDKCFEYNNLLPSKVDMRKRLIKDLINTVDDNFVIEAPIHFDYGENISIGKNFYSNYNLTVLDGTSVSFGDNCFIGPNCSFYTAVHPVDYKLRNKGLEKALPIKVGNNVWFGGGVTVLPGVTIGNNVVVGAGSVVSHDVTDNVVVAGNPAKIIRRIEEVN